jgi:hypothetical protein
MPYKFNESGRHKIPVARYGVTNWPEYDAALVRRGSLTRMITAGYIGSLSEIQPRINTHRPPHTPAAISLRASPAATPV